ncbi:LOW QUALITY PROTEIN: zinc finger protein 106 [Scomber scombrus]|uniref:LOW QUALITY PROTEIN: zinc finger protein 106 n=1 Tax=Scomber scombrus TaxID=13677 RepID=A0AAV1P1Z4_SCOSC
MKFTHTALIKVMGGFAPAVKMARDRKCILCETVHVSKQEMDEHMRSMLHHRELEKLKGRDCGHECRVCKVTVVSLTDYASHISSPTHKQNVEAAEQKPAGIERDEDYFDQALVELIERRKEQIRKDKEAAAAKRAQEEEERKKKEQFQTRLKEAKERFRLQNGWQQPSEACSGSNQHNSWYRGNRYSARPGDARPWHNSQQGKSATWHAQEPPNFQRWASGEFQGGSLHNQGAFGNKQWYQGAFPGSQQSRLPWLSNAGSSNGIYGRNNISQYPQRNRPVSMLGPPPMYPPPPSFFTNTVKQLQNTGSGQGDKLQKGEEQNAECDHNSTKSSKSFGSNPKLDKVCRWSPYPVTKGFDSVLHKDTHSNSSEKYPKVSKPPKQEKATETSAFIRHARPEQKPGQLTSSGQSVEEKGKLKKSPKNKPRDRSSSGSRSSSSTLKEGQQNSSSGSSSHKANKPSLLEDKKLSSVPSLNSGAPHSKTSSQVHPQSKSPTKHSAIRAPSIGPLQSRQERQLPETFKKAREIVLEKRGSLDSSINNKLEMTRQAVEEQLRDHAQSQVGVNKENSCRQNAAKPTLLDSIRPSPHGEEKEKLALPSSSDSSQFLQSLQVSTSTSESLEPATSSREEEENRKNAEKEACSEAPGEAMQAVEAGHGSESDASRSDEAQTVSGSNASSLSKLDLPPVLKRDLTKHISSKSKAGGHEPNLNFARRVRNVSESRRSDTEKDSGLKPTVRQLISSSGSRRNVNWEQVYQEVRKKQDKGKGMPRFGIEMVPYDQEDQSQEEDDIPLLEGFQWESLMDVSGQAASRKRSLSESSLAPASAHTLFPSHLSKETTQRESLSSEQQGSLMSPKSLFAKEKNSQQEMEQMLGHYVSKAQMQPEKLTTGAVKALQRSDSVLGDSSSGTEMLDGQGTGKRRRGAADVPSPETSCLEHNNKRRKIKSKRERFHIDQLLAVSLREDELSRSLQTVDTNLIQARAALEAAYIEVQRLMVVKQQMTTEMSTLRNKRIDLLKGMQGSLEVAPLLKLKEEKMDAVESESYMPSSVTDTAAGLSPTQTAQRASPPSSSLPFMPVVIKQEPQSPVHVSSELDPVENTTYCAHSTTLELPVAPVAASPPDPILDSQLSPERNPEWYQANRQHERESFGEHVDSKESLSGLAETTEKATPATPNCLASLQDSKISLKLLSASRRSSEVGSVGECSTTQSFETPSVPSVLNMPASPSEMRSGKRVRKLKKRKVLKKAQGTEQPESSDTEVDTEASRPRWLKTRRRPSGGSQVAPAELTMTLDSEDSMEITAACQQTHVQVPDSSRPEPLSLACNEVTSTSDMDICKSSESEAPLPKITKASSDASSDHGEDDIPTEGAFDGHQEAVNAMQIHNGLLYTCSGDRTVKAFDLVSHKCVAVFEGHSSKVNCLFVSAAPCLHHRLYSGSSDQTIRCYNLKTGELEQQFSMSDRVICLHSRWKILYAGLANGTVVTFNLKTNKQMDVFECHGPRAVSCLASSQEGARRILLVGSYDSTISVRDAKNGLLLRTLEGHTKTVLCMKVVNDLVFSGSSDQCVHAHNIHTGELVRVYKGHSHAVTVVAILGKVMVTACLDKLVRVFDLQSHEQLQVYGGHKDMVMCLAIHKNMIYTGCYDGSVQAVKLNLMQNYRCWWNSCSLVFGLMEHLHQHLINDHTCPNVQTLKCRWKNCEEFFCARNGSKQGMPVHMQKHAEETELEP